MSVSVSGLVICCHLNIWRLLIAHLNGCTNSTMMLNHSVKVDQLAVNVIDDLGLRRNRPQEIQGRRGTLIFQKKYKNIL